MHQQHDDPRVRLVLIGFGEPQRLAAVARKLGWPGDVLGDGPRALYQRLGIGRAPWWRVYNPGTLLTYAKARAAGTPLPRRLDEDTRQLGADAVALDGAVVRVWRPRSPDDRPPAAEVLAAASAVADEASD